MRRYVAALLVLASSACGDDAATWVSACAADSEAAERAALRGDDRAAERHLRAIAARPAPGDVARTDVSVVRRDALERLAQVLLRRGESEAALVEANRAIALGVQDDVTSVNALSTRGRVLEALGRDREAARDYHRALEITERLLDRTLEGR